MSQSDQQRRIMKSWDHAAQLLKWHFHVVCRGEVPLSMKWRTDIRSSTGVDDKALEFIDSLKRLLDSPGMSNLYKAAKSK